MAEATDQLLLGLQQQARELKAAGAPADELARALRAVLRARRLVDRQLLGDSFGSAEAAELQELRSMVVARPDGRPRDAPDERQRMTGRERACLWWLHCQEAQRLRVDPGRFAQVAHAGGRDRAETPPRGHTDFSWRSLGGRADATRWAKLLGLVVRIRATEESPAFRRALLRDQLQTATEQQADKATFTYGSTPFDSWWELVNSRAPVRAAVARCQSGGSGLCGQQQCVVFGSALGLLAFYGAVGLGMRTVGFEILPCLAAMAAKFARSYEVPRSELALVSGCMLEAPLDQAALVVLTSLCWEAPLVARVHDKLARELPVGALVIDYTEALDGRQCPGHDAARFVQACAPVTVAVSWSQEHQRLHVFEKRAAVGNGGGAPRPVLSGGGGGGGGEGGGGAATASEPVDRWLCGWPPVRRQFHAFLDQLRRCQARGSTSCARATLRLLRTVLGACAFASVQDMLDRVRAVGVELADAQPVELAVGNVVRRVLCIIREEHAALWTSSEGNGRPGAAALLPSLDRVLSHDVWSRVDFSQPVDGLRSAVLGQVDELAEELETAHESIMEQALAHISDQSVILTFGRSRSVERLLLAAAENHSRRFKVFVAESAPYFGGQETALVLAEQGVDVTVVPDGAVFALMPRVDKVLLPTHAVVANGGLIAPSGGHVLALAANEHSVPVVVVTSLFKFCPVQPHNVESFNELGSPAAVLDGAERHAACDAALNPAFDYVPPELLSLFVTNTGGYPPSYIYRLVVELYHPADRVLVQNETDEIGSRG